MNIPYIKEALSRHIIRAGHDSIQIQSGCTDILLLHREVVRSSLAKHDGCLSGNTVASWWYSWLRIEDHSHWLDRAKLHAARVSSPLDFSSTTSWVPRQVGYPEPYSADFSNVAWHIDVPTIRHNPRIIGKLIGQFWWLLQCLPAWKLFDSEKLN